MSNIPAPRPIEDEILTIPEIAFLARHPRTKEPLARGSVEQWRNRYDDARALPEPDGYTGYQPYWRLDRLLTYMDEQNRPYDVEKYREHRDAGGFRRHQDLI